jgi:hypothetical protein
MTPTDIIPALLRDGAALTLFVPDAAPQTLVLDSAHVLAPHALIYYVVGQDYTGGVHRIDFDELRAPHALSVEFLRGGHPVAYLTTIAEDGEESVAAWQAWQRHLTTQRAAHTEAVAAEMRGFTGEED